MALVSKKYQLDASGLDQISEEIETRLESSMKLPRRDVLRLRLAMEELMLRIMERNGDSKPESVLLAIGKQYGRQVIQLRYGGDAFDPTRGSQEEASELSVNILANLGLMPSWSYRRGWNLIQLRPPKATGRSQLFYLLLAVLCAGVFGAAGVLLPPALKEGITSVLLVPTAEAFLGLLNTFAGFLIFLTVTSGLFGVGDTVSLGRIGKVVFSRILISMLVTAVLAVVLPQPFLRLSAGSGGNGNALQGISEMIFQILPRNPISPFQDGNTLQIIVLAVAVGLVLLLLGDRARGVSALIGECGSIVNTIMEYVCKLIPIFVFVSLLQQIWSGALGNLVGLWKPVLVFAAVNLIVTLLMALWISLRRRIPLLVLLQKIFPVFLVAFTTASSMASYATGVDTCLKKLGIHKQLVDFSYPIGIVMYMPSTVLFYTLVPVYLALVYQVETGVTWFITCALLTCILAIASPPIPGSALTCLGILLTQLNIPMEGMLMAVALNVVLDFVLTGFNVAFLQLELICQAEKLGMLDEALLRSR